MDVHGRAALDLARMLDVLLVPPEVGPAVLEPEDDGAGVPAFRLLVEALRDLEVGLELSPF